MQPVRWRTGKAKPDRVFSMNALRRAWQGVRRNGQSPGTDGVTPDAFGEHLDRELNRLRQQILGRTYEPAPVRRFMLRTASGKERPITVWAVRDRVAQRAVVDYLTPAFEDMFLPCSYGYRPGMGVQQAVAAVDHFHRTDRSWVVDADIRDCFGSIDLDLLTRQVRRTVHLPMVVGLIESWLKTPVERRRHEVAGVSQGGVISPLLANLYLHTFDQMMLASLPGIKLVRFADDFITLSATEDEAAWSLEVARRSLENLRLKMNMRKTRIVHFDEGFVFLGYRFHGDTTTRDE